MKIETKCLHSGYQPKNGEPSVMPIVQSTTYRFDSCDHVAELFDKPTEFMYSRFANPTCECVEKKIADFILEHPTGLIPLSITELADKCGFSTVSAFSNAFRRVFGISPRTYRQKAEKRSLKQKDN